LQTKNALSPSLMATLGIFKTLVHLSKQIKKVELTQKDQSVIFLLEEKQFQLKEAKNEIKAKNMEIKILSDRIVALVDGSRQETASRLQETIERLTLTITSHEAEIDDLQVSKRQLQQENASVKDLLLTTRSQLDSVREQYDKDIHNFQPVLARQIQTTTLELADIKGLRTDIGINNARIGHAERARTAAIEEKEKIREEVVKLRILTVRPTLKGLAYLPAL